MVEGILGVLVKREDRKGTDCYRSCEFWLNGIDYGVEDRQRRCYAQEGVQRMGAVGWKGALEVDSVYLLVSSPFAGGHIYYIIVQIQIQHSK